MEENKNSDSENQILNLSDAGRISEAGSKFCFPLLDYSLLLEPKFKYNNKEYHINPSIIIQYYWHLITPDAQDFIIEFMYGGRDSSKSYTTAEILILECLCLPYFRCALIREQSGDVKDSQWQLIKDIVESWGMEDLFEFRKAPLEIECKLNKHKFIARGCNEPQNLKSITACNRAWIEEGVAERESMTIILGTIRSSESKVKVYYTFNPEFKGDYHKWWLYEDWFAEYWSAENLSFTGTKRMIIKIPKVGAFGHPIKGSTETVEKIIILKYRVTHSTYHNNPFITDERIALHESNKGYYYTVYTLGLFGYLITGGEYLPSFDSNRHCKILESDNKLPFHISIDSNTAPYFTISGWQINETEKKIRQIWELPCRSPHASGTRAARKLSNYLQGLGYDDTIFLYGDATANNKTTVDENNKSTFDKFRDELKSNGWTIDDHIGKSNPRVSLAGDFINEVLDELPSSDGWTVEINKGCGNSNKGCPESIEDYTMSKKDMNGGILKKIVTDKPTGVKYQERGHFTDVFKYLLCTVLDDLFVNFGNKKKKGGGTMGKGNWKRRGGVGGGNGWRTS